MAGLLDLPPEVHLMINSWLPEVSLVCLAYTCRYFFAMLDPPPTPPGPAIIKFNREREGKDPTRQRLICIQCRRLRRFFHFDRKQASPKTASGVRRCLDCTSGSKRLKKLIGQKFIWISTTKITVCPHCRQMVIYEAEDNYHERLVISPHVGDPICARHSHHVRVRRCAGGSRPRVPCTDRCDTCHKHCSTPNCPETLNWGESLCGKGHENHDVVWDVLGPPPSDPEIVVSRLRAMLDQARPPPLRSDFFPSPRQRQNKSISELIHSLPTGGLERGNLLEEQPGGIIGHGSNED